LEEQRAIISEIDRRLSIIREMEHEVEVNLKRAERLRQSIFKKAFSGTLVQQEKVVYSAGARSDLPMAAEEIMPYGKKA
jgi:type I restriction enzyme S subunit